MKKVNIPLDEDTHTKAKIISTIKKITLADYLKKAIEEYVKKDDEVLDKIKKKLG